LNPRIQYIINALKKESTETIDRVATISLNNNYLPENTEEMPNAFELALAIKIMQE